ncbi:MAG: FAD-dependent oxidoreductase [Oscillospiraceae bacterium]|nr:FAD-dependent oxidoreductase [Oscillospiraceae bacterium]
MMPSEAKHKKNVLVAGGGVGGMEAAIQAAKLGHKVTLCEKTDKLGGVLNCEHSVPFKKNLPLYLKRQARLLELNGVEVKLNTAVTPELCEEMKPDVLIASLGARPIVPKIDGIEKAVMAETVYNDIDSVKGDVVILGAGLVGIELSIWLGQLGHNVTIVEMASKPSYDYDALEFSGHKVYMEKAGVKLMLNTKAVGIADGKVLVETTDGAGEVAADTVICAVGQKPLTEEADALAFCAPEYHVIGDCIRPDNILSATRQAYAVARNIGRV